MMKVLAWIVAGLLLAAVFWPPSRNYLNNILVLDKSGAEEAKIIGRSSGYNPRVLDIQKILEDACFEPGVADGIMGARTRRAIKDFQRERGLAVNGRVDSGTWLALSRERFANRELAMEESLALTEAVVFNRKPGEAPISPSAASSGPAVTDNKQGAAFLDPAPAVGPVKPAGFENKVAEGEGKTGHSKTPDNRAIQKALQKAGFYKGKIDGKIGIQSQKGIRDFQKARGLKADGILGPKTWNELSKYLVD